jgi:hypothetical protein
MKVTDLDLQYDDALRVKFLLKLKVWMDKFVDPKSSASLQNLILYHVLKENERLGKYDKEVFRQYLQVNKQCVYNSALGKSKKSKSKQQFADFNYVIPKCSHFLGPVGDDLDLVVRHFRHLFSKKEEQAKRWSDIVDGDFLKTVLCETRLMSGGSKNADLRKMYTKIQGKYAMPNLQSFVCCNFF